MGRPGLWELIIIAILVVVIFGGRKLPELGRGLGLAWTNFRRGLGAPTEEAGEAGRADSPDKSDGAL